MKYTIWVHIEEQDGKHDPAEACEPISVEKTFISQDRAEAVRDRMIEVADGLTSRQVTALTNASDEACESSGADAARREVEED